MMEKWSATCTKLFTGEVKVNKRDLWFLGGLCLLAGVVYGLGKAPWTHGVTIGSNNGNYSGGAGECACTEAGCGEEAEDAAEEVRRREACRRTRG